MWTPTRKLPFKGAILPFFFWGIFAFSGTLFAAEAPPPSGPEKGLPLDPLINEALSANPELKAMEQRARAAGFRVPQARALPDPMVMFGYQNVGWSRYTYGKNEDAVYMYSASQTFPFPGKLGLKGEMAQKDAESLQAEYEGKRLEVEQKVKELYYDLFLAYKEQDIIRARKDLFDRVEEAALARYTAGMAPQQDVIMAQTEKYMLKEKDEMLTSQISSTGAMLNSTLGRDTGSPPIRPEEIRPEEIEPVTEARSMEDYLAGYAAFSPKIKSGEKMVESADAKVRMAKKEYYPDFTLTGSVFTPGNGFDDMWSLTTQINIPLWYKKKQRQAVNEADASLIAARNELDSTKLMIAAGIRDNYAMITASRNLLKLYKEGIIPKITQDFEAALAGYNTGRVEAITVINRLKALLDTESLYWKQAVEERKAFARLKGLTGMPEEKETPPVKVK
jgi:cobalt-zinc-cadmium efflux system outer membrane protein